MAIQYSDEIRNRHIAPGVSAFTSADIPDMAEHATDSQHWVANFFLNSAFRASFKPLMDAYAYNFLRRAQFAFAEHGLARRSTLAFLAGGSQSVTHYVEALFHWECFLGQAWHAYALLVSAWDGRAFERTDGSVEQRLNALYNQMKHVETRIENAQMPAGATVPVWLEDRGLRSLDADLSYPETAEILRDLAGYAKALVDPKTAKDRMNSTDA